MKTRKKLTIALLCGGPSRERGISLNSARSVLDHVSTEGREILPLYFDYKKRAFKISRAQLYSNTPSDFDFKLMHTATPLTPRALIRALTRADIAFPVMHGPFGEDGGIQTLLERHAIPFIGSSSSACKRMFDKYEANEFIRAHGFTALPSAVLKIYHKDHRAIIERFFTTHRIKRAAVKPASGGSSIGVFSVTTPAEALARVRYLFSKRYDTRVVIEPFAQGREFTVIILQNRFDQPVALIPTEIEADYTKHQIFDYRKKYLPTRQVVYHCPPRFDDDIIDRIQVQAEQLFSLFGMRDFARLDGWLLNDGRIWFSDFNPVSGMEQNSFLFQQASRVGLSHRGSLRLIINHACARNGIAPPPSRSHKNGTDRRKPVHVLFGGSTSERQVSLMSGTNVWLKLIQSQRYRPVPFLLDAQQRVWELPYTYTLNHTVEEIVENCLRAPHDHARLSRYERRARLRLAFGTDEAGLLRTIPASISLHHFIQRAPFVFIGLHGGIGEDGTLQKKLVRAHVPYTGSGPDVSRLCMDKWHTDQFIRNAKINGVGTAPTLLVPIARIPHTTKSCEDFWTRTGRALSSRTLLVKPRADGCSSGVAHLTHPRDLQKYLHALRTRAVSLPAGTLRGQENIIEMPAMPIHELLVQKFIETDKVRVVQNRLKHRRRTGWIEVTIGLMEKKGDIRVFDPSLTVTEGKVLTVEEKFQGGTGINITPPPATLVSPRARGRAKKLAKTLAHAIGLRGYARIDAFMRTDSGNLLIIEVNTLPALTPSTVLFQQALNASPPFAPQEFLEKIIESAGY